MKNEKIIKGLDVLRRYLLYWDPIFFDEAVDKKKVVEDLEQAIRIIKGDETEVNKSDVLKGLECCTKLTSDDPFLGCNDCPYNQISVNVEDCRAALSEDALKLLKKPNPLTDFPELQKTIKTIIKGLRCCLDSPDDCAGSKCPYFRLDDGCRSVMEHDALDLLAALTGLEAI